MRLNLRMKDASQWYRFRMNDADKIEVIGVVPIHYVTITHDSPAAVIDTEYSVIAAWLANGESVILDDPFTGIQAILAETGTGAIAGDGVNMESFIARRYEVQGDSEDTVITITTNGPMTQEEIITAVMLGWNT